MAFGEFTRFLTRVNARYKQNFAAQVVTQSRQKSLVKIHRVQCPARKGFALQSLCDLSPGQMGAQNVGADALKKGVLLNMIRIPDTDIRCAVEEGAVLFSMEGEPQLTIGVGEFVPHDHPPHAVKLIVGVDRGAGIEVGQ